MSDHTDAPCLTCDGTGTVVGERPLDVPEETCRDCDGSGCDDECRHCADEECREPSVFDDTPDTTPDEPPGWGTP